MGEREDFEKQRAIVRSLFRFEGDIQVYQQKWEENLRKRTKLIRWQAVAAGALIGTGVGGSVGLGLDPYAAVPLVCFGASFGFGGYSMLLTRNRDQEEVDFTIKMFGDSSTEMVKLPHEASGRSRESGGKI